MQVKSDAVQTAMGLDEETEPGVCFRCEAPGIVLYDLEPLGIVRCPHCQLVFVSPRLSEASRKRLYDDGEYFTSGVYGSRRAEALQRRWIKARLRLIESSWTQSPPERILEIGCAHGHFLASAKAKGLEITGVEYSRSAARVASDTLGVDIWNGEVETLPSDIGQFDVVAFWDVLEHVPDPHSFLSAIREALTRDGIAAFSCPYFNSLPSRVLRARWWNLKPRKHLWHFTTGDLRLLFREAGLDVFRIIRNPFVRSNLGRLDSIVGLARPCARLEL